MHHAVTVCEAAHTLATVLSSFKSDSNSFDIRRQAWLFR